MGVQKYSDIVPAVRDSTYAGKAEQVQVSELIGKTVLIKDVKVDKDDRGDWADYLIEMDDKALCFITGSGPLNVFGYGSTSLAKYRSKDTAKTIIEKGLLKAGDIEATLRSTRSKSSHFSYYTWE